MITSNAIVFKLPVLPMNCPKTKTISQQISERINAENVACNGVVRWCGIAHRDF